MAERNDTLGLRILIAEDEALIAEEIQDRLGRLGFEIVGIVDSSDAAIISAETGAPDLVLMDIRLKGPKDGIETAAFIREHLRIPVVYLTAHSDKSTIGRAKETAPFGYVLKPFQEKELLIAIEMAIHMHRLEQQVARRTEELQQTVEKLQKALDEVHTLRGLLPICAWCKKIRDDRDYWHSVEEYLSDYADVHLSHTLCPECYTKQVSSVQHQHDP
ncbi:MAG TPA: response regulator [Chthoniobacterales bacterium]|jgi:AmiR/NasT family two-component response regulator